MGLGEKDVLLAEGLERPASLEDAAVLRAHASQQEMPSTLAPQVRRPNDDLGGGHVEVPGPSQPQDERTYLFVEEHLVEGSLKLPGGAKKQ